MAWTSYQILIAVVMIITGTINTLSAKWADKEHSVGRGGGDPRPFNHPFVQACGMFIGEFTCLLAFKFLVLMAWRAHNRAGINQNGVATVEASDAHLGNQKFHRLVFWPAALCDMLGTSLMYVGLNLTYASSFQMLRGAVIIFTALLSVAFLNTRLRGFHWVGIALIIAGLSVVGVSDVMFNQEKHADIYGIIAGDLLIIAAQIIVAVQMVYEQKFVKSLNIHPLQAVGWEGFFGFFTLALACIPLSFIYVGDFTNNPNHTLEDPVDAFVQLGNNRWLIVATLANILSIAFFNFAGVSVTKEIGATTRMVLDSLRTLFIWVIGLALGWQAFIWLQVPGFILLLLGMALYNEVLLGPFLYQKLGWEFFAPVDDMDAEEDADVIGVIPSGYAPVRGEDADEDAPLLRR